MNKKDYEKVLTHEKSGNDDHGFGDIQESVDQIIDISHWWLS